MASAMMTLVRRILPVLFATLLAVGCGDATTTGTDARLDALFGELPFGTLNHAQARRMLDTAPEDDGPFYLVNFIRHRERAAYPDGRESALSGAEADALYGQLVLPILLDIGARPFYVGGVERTLLEGDGAGWTQVAVALYPSRAAFFAMLERPDFRAAAVHKIAGVERSIVLVTEPADGQLPADIRRLDLSTVPYPPTPDDQPVNVVHALRFNDVAQYPDGRPTELTGREAFEIYEQNRIPQAVPLGVRPGITLDVEGELIGDGRTWDEVRLNNFPSRAAFAELVRVESLTAAGYEHRQAALADTYAVLASPIVNEVGYLPPLPR